MFAERGQVIVPGFGRFAIGRGHSFADLPAKLFVKVRAGAVERIVASDADGTRIAQIWPPYATAVLIRGSRYFVATAVTVAEDNAARALLTKEHPEGAADHGLLFCLYETVGAGDRNLIGVSQLGEYYHTRPSGRDAFSRPMNGAGFRSLGRGAEIKSIPIASAKRFALTEDRQDNGLGRLLGRQTLKVARNYRWPSARVVEVIRYQRARRYLQICCQSERDFLTRSGYVPVPLAEWIRNGQIIARIAAIPAHRTVAGYYYADLTDADRPGFVARVRAQIG